MTCKTLDFTPWYELQADSESDDEHESGYGITVKDLSLSHYYSASGRDCGPTFSEQLDGETKWYTLQREPISASFKGGGRRGLREIQHLLEEMDDAAKKINECNAEKSTFSAQRGLALSESETSDEGMSLQEFPIDVSSKPSEVDGSGCGEVVSSAIAEISKEFTTGNLSTGPLVSGDSDESRLSSDNEVRRRLGAAHAHYPETATGFSDSDWNPYVTESDTNVSPRGAAEFPSAALLSGVTDSKINSSVSSFNPPFSSTKAGSSVNKTNGGSIACSKNSYANTLHLDDIREQGEKSFRSLKFDGTVSSQPLSRSKLSEYSISKHTEDPVSTSTFLEDYAPGFQTCIETASLPTVSGDARKKMQTSLVQVDDSTRKQGQEWIKPKLESAQNAPSSDFEKGSVEEKLQSLQHFEDLPQSSFTGHLDSRRSLPGKGYFSSQIQKALLGPQKEKQLKAFSELCSSIDQARWDALQRNMSVPAGGLQKKTFQTEMTPGLQTSTNKSNTTITGTQAGESDVRLSTSSTTSLAVPKETEKPLKEQELSDLPASKSKPDELNQQVQKLLLETAYLTGSSRTKVGSSKQQSTSLDYKQLHLDLQEIQDSLKMMGQHSAVSPRDNTIKTVGEKEFEIVPSTTTTPERGRQLVWDYGADLGYGQVQMEDMMSDITSACSPTDTGYSGGDRVQYTSDGEETRTSGSSLKDHAEEEEQQEDTKVSSAQTHQTSTTNNEILDDLISDFRQESQAVENRYQALCSLGVTKTAAREVDLVRKRLDLSSLSDSFITGVTQNTGNGLKPDLEKFSAVNCAQILISNQMKKMADRTFNHSIELHTPVRQVLECYPVYTSQHDQPQHQQLQQELQLHLQQQQASASLPPSSPPPPPPPQLSLPATQQRARKVGEAEEIERTEIVQQRFKAVEVKGQDGKEETRDQQEDSQSTVTSPADSDRSCELRKGKYRPYRPTGIHDIYYTESDTASVADSVTTAESTHTGSDDALGPHFPSSVLGSRRDISGSEAAGIYSKHGKVSTAMGSSVHGSYLPTIQERATPDRLAKEASDIAQSKLKKGTPDDNTAVDDSASTAVDKKSTDITGMIAKQQGQVEDILRQQDAARRIPGQQSVPPTPNDKLAEHTNKKEVYVDPKAVKSNTVNRPEAPHAVTSTSVSYSSQQKFGDENSDGRPEVHRELLGSSGSSHRSNIPVHGPAHDDHVDDRSYSNVRKAVLHDNFRRVFDREQSEDGAYMRLTDSGEARIPRLFDANAKTDITHQRKQLSTDNISSSSQSLTDLKGQKHLDEMHYMPENKMFEDHSSSCSSREILQQRQKATKAKSDSSDWYVTRDLAVEGAVGKKADNIIARESEQSHIREQDRHGYHILQGSVADESCGETNGQRAEVEDVQRLERKYDLKDNSIDETESHRSRRVAQQSLHQLKETRKQQNEVQMEGKVETREEVVQPAVLRKRQELRKTAWMTEREDVEKQTQKTEELLKREVEVMRQFHRRRILEKETENQQEVEEVVEGGLRPHVHTDADRELLQEGCMLLHGKETEELIDQAPISRRAQLLREALEQEEAYRGHPDLQALWERFMSTSTAGSDYESSYNSIQLQGLAELLQNPAQHLVHRFVQQRQLLREEDYRRAEAQRERYQKEMKIQQTDRQHVEEESAAMKREHLRQEARKRQQRLSSEEESNGSYGEMLQEREQERLKRREVRTLKKKQSSLASPSPRKTVSVKTGHSLADLYPGCAGETTETLYSIPEDTTHDSSPLRNRSPTRSRNSGIQRKLDVIDPNMSRLRERIIKQREKIEQEHRREARRDQKLQKLNALLEAKRTGLMDDSTVSAHLATISSTSAGSSFDSEVQDSHAKLTSSEESTTAKDSSAEMQQAKVTHARHLPISFKRQPVASKPEYAKDLLGFEGSTLLWDSSSSQMDIDPSCSDELLGVLRRDKKLRFLSKYGSKHMKPHQMYSPYLRQKEPELTGHMAIGARCCTSQERKCYCKTKDAGTMYPSPRNSAASYQIKHPGGRYVSQGAQTSPDRVKGERQKFKSRSPSLSHDQQPVIQVPLTTAKNGVQVIAGNQLLFLASREQATSAQPRAGKRPFSWQGRSISPAFDSRGVAACLSSERERPHSSSPPRTRNRTHRSPSLVELRLQSWTGGDNPQTHYQKILRTKQQAPSPARRPGSMSPQRERQGQKIGRSEEIESFSKKDFSSEFKENHLPPKHQHKFSGLSAIPGGLAWFIPVTESRPWRMPFKERQAYALRQENWPQNLLHENRNTFVNGEFFGENLDCYGGNAAKFYLDKASKKMEEEIGRQYDMFDPKPLCRMSLQEALISRKPEFVSALRQRQKRLYLAAEHRRLQALVRAEQEMIFLNHRKTVANPEAHPYGENLHQPKKRVFTKQEMREQTEKKYQHLPEVKAKELERRRNDEYKLNRLRAKVYNKRIQRKVLDKMRLRTCS